MSDDQNVAHEQYPGCKHDQRGFCRNRSQCYQEHNNKICKESVCRNQMCREKHPKPCKFYIRNGQCMRKEEYAYEHNKSDDNIKIEIKVKKKETIK